MELFGIAVTLLAAVLTYQAWQNGRWMKQAHRETQELIKAMHSDMAEAFRRSDEWQKRLEEKTEETKKVSEETKKASEEARKASEEARKAGEEARKEAAETLREIARLIVAEGEKTRQIQKT